MAVKLQIVHGSPNWISPSVVPSKDLAVSTLSPPSVAAISFNSTDVFIYVRVDNLGTVDLGVCDCATPLPAAWALSAPLTGFASAGAAGTGWSSAPWTFEATSSFDRLKDGGVLVHSWAVSASGQRAYGSSPNGAWFAYARSQNGLDWFLTIVALKDVVRSDGTVVKRATKAVDGAAGGYTVQWNSSTFAWAGSTAVVAKGPGFGATVYNFAVACPLAFFPNVFSDVRTVNAGQLDWEFRTSPCGVVVAIVPKILGPAGGTQFVDFVSTRKAQKQQPSTNNLPAAIQIFGPSPTLTTQQHGANGVRVATGASGGAGTAFLDDPDCMLVLGGVRARVDRVKASTLPSANLGVVPVGNSAVGALKAGQSRWLQVPNTAGWNNQGDPHWCFLAQAFTADLTTIPKPWDGQAASPPAFPNWLVNCAQRNHPIN